MRKDYKLSESIEYQRVFKKNKSLRDRNWLILYRANDLGIPRLGLAVSKKNVKKAVQRNRLKRIIRETFRLKREQLIAVDIVVLARQDIMERSNAELIKTLSKLWQKLEEEHRT